VGWWIGGRVYRGYYASIWGLSCVVCLNLWVLLIVSEHLGVLWMSDTSCMCRCGWGISFDQKALDGLPEPVGLFWSYMLSYRTPLIWPLVMKGSVHISLPSSSFTQQLVALYIFDSHCYEVINSSTSPSDAHPNQSYGALSSLPL